MMDQVDLERIKRPWEEQYRDDDGLLLLKTFHKQEIREEGPPNRFEADDINKIFGSAFELITSSDSVFESTLDSDPKALFCILKKTGRE